MLSVVGFDQPAIVEELIALSLDSLVAVPQWWVNDRMGVNWKAEKAARYGSRGLVNELHFWTINLQPFFTFEIN